MVQVHSCLELHNYMHWEVGKGEWWTEGPPEQKEVSTEALETEGASVQCGIHTSSGAIVPAPCQ
jgi:hypothetical protein